MVNSSEVAAKIHQLTAIRKALGWSEETCAHQLGVTYSTLNRWERGESFPKSLLVLKAIEHFIATYGKRLDTEPRRLDREGRDR